MVPSLERIIANPQKRVLLIVIDHFHMNIPKSSLLHWAGSKARTYLPCPGRCLRLKVGRAMPWKMPKSSDLKPSRGRRTGRHWAECFNNCDLLRSSGA